jgi:hypothetical protein
MIKKAQPNSLKYSNQTQVSVLFILVIIDLDGGFRIIYEREAPLDMRILE